MKITVKVFNKRGDDIDTFQINREFAVTTEDAIGWMRRDPLALMDHLGGVHVFSKDVVGNIKTEELN